MTTAARGEEHLSRSRTATSQVSSVCSIVIAETCFVRYMKLFNVDNDNGVGRQHPLGRMEVGAPIPTDWFIVPLRLIRRQYSVSTGS